MEPKTRAAILGTVAFDGLCFEGHHKFEKAGYLVINPHSVPVAVGKEVESCEWCGLVRLKMEK